MIKIHNFLSLHIDEILEYSVGSVVLYGDGDGSHLKLRGNGRIRTW